MKKFTLVLAGFALILSLSACGKTNSSSDNTDDKIIKIAASATPHSEILEQVKPILEKKGFQLEVKVFNDYVQPNKVVDSGDMDANYFQHITYLNNFNEEQGTKLVSAGNVHYEPFGIYPGTKSQLSEVAAGDVIAVPNDVTNEARALLLLQELGLIKLKDGAGITATKNDIVDNPKSIEIKEMEAAQIPRVKDEVAFIVLNGNYALTAGYNVINDSLGYESNSSEAAAAYVNVVAVKEGSENQEKIKALMETLKNEEIKKFIEEKYNGSVVPID